MKYYFAIFSLVLSFTLSAQRNNYQVSLDLIRVENDQVAVNIQTPQVNEETVEYHMAKIVPGTYSISDFGRFVTDFEARDEAGNALVVEKNDVNKWTISGAQQLHSITYKVHDSFDQFEGYGDNVLFEPGGSNIEAERNVFVINTFGFVGYLDGYKFHPYELSISHKKELSGATALERLSSSDTLDIYTASDFNFLADGPLMYSVADVATKKMANAEILVSVFSPNNKLSAQEVMDKISDLMEAQSKYLGGELPVERYAYLIYLLDKPSLSGSMGALEHSYSSVYTLPEAGADRIGQTVRDVAAHEFFHIVTPLNIHSEEIGDFDYIDPKMSKHLWLYEGCTEYASMHVQVKYGLYSGETFLDEIKQKILTKDRFPTDVPFTLMSEKILEPQYEPMYTNVYFKGALIGMCLDLYLLKLSKGEYDLQNLMRDLAKKYGPSKSFKDDDLFIEIESFTYPEIGEFLRTYVAGEEPLPIVEYLSWAGVNYTPFEEYEDFTLGQIGLGLNEDREIHVTDASGMNAFGEAMGYQEGDVLNNIMGTEVSLDNINEILETYTEGLEEGDKVKVKVYREVNGERKLVKLKAKALKVTKQNKHILKFDEAPTADEQMVRDAWIKAS